MTTAVEAPRLLLGLRSLNGVSLATRDRLLEIVARYREPESLAVTLAKAVECGVDGVFTSLSPAVRSAIAELKLEVPLYAVVPALGEYERQDLAPGLEDAIDLSRSRADATARFRAGIAGGFSPAVLFEGDFARRLPLLVEAELSAVRRGTLRGVVLDAWFTDLALAAGNAKLFDAFCKFVRRRTHGAAGFETRNLGVLLLRLREWGVQPDLVIGPVNPSGLLMKPTVGELLAELARAEVPVVARELCAGGVDTLANGGSYARAHGAYGLAPDLAEMDDVTTELRALKA
jgi:hypothetical protein